MLVRFRFVALLPLVAACAEDLEAQPPVRYADPWRMDGPQYASCAYAAWVGDTLFESGWFDDRGHQVAWFDCYEGANAISGWSEVYAGDLPIAHSDLSRPDPWHPFDAVTRELVWQGGLLVAERGPDLARTYTYDDAGRRLRVAHDEYTEAWGESWTWEGGTAHVVSPAREETLTWDAEERLVEVESADVTTTHRYGDDGIVATDTRYADGSTDEVTFTYDGAGRRASRGDLVYVWGCRD